MDNIKIKVQKLSNDAVIPEQAYNNDAGIDLVSVDNVEILPGECKKIHTGLAFELPANTFGAVFARSGLASKRGLRPANCVGVCDADYRGEYLVALYNDSNQVQSINKGDKIAQLLILPVYTPNIEVVDKLSDTQRGEGGFGSSDYDCNRSQFELNKHIAKYVNYLEVIIDEEGIVHYATPSHQEKLISMACDKLNISREQLNDMCPKEYYTDFTNWLAYLVNAVVVYTDFYTCMQPLNSSQFLTLCQLKDSGVYAGELTNSYKGQNTIS